jgi:hypothetical protein
MIKSEKKRNFSAYNFSLNNFFMQKEEAKKKEMIDKFDGEDDYEE